MFVNEVELKLAIDNVVVEKFTCTGIVDAVPLSGNTLSETTET